MKQRRFFSPALWWEGVRQTRIIGIVGVILIAVQIFLTMVLPCLSQTVFIAEDDGTVIAQVVDGLTVAPILTWSSTVAAPVLTLFLFRFLNRRNCADFYHALPASRVCLYFSFMASVFFWLLIFALEAILLVLFYSAVFSQYYSLLVASFLLYVLSTTIAALATAAGISIAMAVTGTTFNNLAVSAMVLFLPRIFLTCLSLAASTAAPILQSEAISPFFNFRLNLVCYNAIGPLFGTEPYYEVSSILYTAVLLLLYLAVGALLFVRRKSEMAHQSAPTPKMQAFWRVLLTIAFFSVFVAIFYTEILEWNILPEVLIPILIFGLLLYFLYELFTTRSFKKMLRAAKSLWIVLLGVLLFFGTLVGINTYALSFQPTKDDLLSITVKSGSDYYNNVYLDYTGYGNLCAPQIRLTDDKLLELMATRLREQAALLQNEGRDAFNERYTRGSMFGYQGYTSLEVSASTLLGTRERTVYLSDEDRLLLTEYMKNDPAFVDAWTTLPEPIGTIALTGTHLNGTDCTDEDARQVFETLREELSTIDFSDWYLAQQNGGGLNQEFTLSYTIGEGPAQGKELGLVIDPELLPETAGVCFEIEHRTLAPVLEALEELSNAYRAASESERENWQININCVLPKESGEAADVSSDRIEALEFVLRHARKTPRTEQNDADPYCYVYIESDNLKTEITPQEYPDKFDSFKLFSCSFVLDEGATAEEYHKAVGEE